jgi:membrane protein YdbS with pleckstrin-like domain
MPMYAGADARGSSQMSAVNLSAGEEIIFEGHPCWRAILGFYLKGVLIAAIAGVVAKLVGASSATVFLIVLVILALTVLIGFGKRVATTYTITNRRLNIKRGLISREIQETRLERVQNVNYNQSLYQRIMQIGDVDFDTAGTSDYDFIFAGVADPADVVQRVDQATGAAIAGGHGLGEAQPPAPPPPQAAPPGETQPPA